MLQEIFHGVARKTVKLTHYFGVYEKLFGQFVGEPVTFVEIGVQNGGSLQMWRRYFGPKARIIGVDLNPASRVMEREGFEVFIGSQSDSAFWRNFFQAVGPIDALLDDGGHTNTQQITTVKEVLPHVRDGGVLAVEDVGTSYWGGEFGNPSRYSFVEFAKKAVDIMNARMPRVPKKPRDPCGLGGLVYSMEFFESVVAFHVDRALAVPSALTTAGAVEVTHEDLRHQSALTDRWTTLKRAYHAMPSGLQSLLSPGKAIAGRMLLIVQRLRVQRQNRSLGRYF